MLTGQEKHVIHMKKSFVLVIVLAAAGLLLLVANLTGMMPLGSAPPPSAAWSQASGQASFPDTAAGRFAKELIEKFNASDLETLKSYHPSDPALWVNLRREVGPVDVHGPITEEMWADPATENSISFWVRGRLTQAWIGLGLTVRSGKLTGSSIIRRVTPSDAPAVIHPENDEALAATLDQYMQGLEAEDIFSGVVLVAREGEPIFERYVGMADKPQNVPITAATRFDLASVSKIFVGTAIAQLAEQGQVDFHEPISTYLPEYPKRVADQVTLHHLLAHTSGIELDHSDAFMKQQARATSIDDLVQAQIDHIEELPNWEKFKPLDGHDYSNEGVLLAAAVIERVTGMQYHEYLRRHIFDPLGMNDSGTVAREAPGANLAISYTYMMPPGTPDLAGERIPNTTSKEWFGPEHGSPVWGRFSTARDLLRFCNALQAGELISESSLETLTTSRASTRLGGYAYTLEIVNDRQGQPESWGHNGGFPGISTTVRVYPKLGYTVIVLSNYDKMALKIDDYVRELIAR